MIRPRWVVLVAVVGVFTLLASACANKSSSGAESAACKNDRFGCQVYKSGEPIKIATLLAITGDNRALGIDSQRGVQLAADYLDGKLDGKVGQLVGHDIKLEFGVADTIFSKKGILLISPSNTGPALTSSGQHQPFYLRTAHNDKIQGAVVADFATQKLQAKTAATIHDDSPYSDGLAAVFRQVFEKQGGKITDNEAIQATQRDFKPILNGIAQHKPDFIYYPAFNPACALIAKQSRSIPALNNTALMGSDGCADPTYVSVGGKDVYGTWSSSPDVTAQTTTNAFYGQQFLPAYQQQFGQKPISVFNAHGWDAAQILFEAIKKVAKDDNGTLTIPRTALKDAIFQTKDYKGLSGTLTCTPLGDCATAVSIAVYKVPAWPIEGGTANPKPVFTETKTLQEASA